MKLLQDWPVKVATPSSSTEPPWLQWGPLFGREARHRLPGGECPVRLESLSGPLKDALRSDRDTCRPHRHLGRRAELRLTLQRLGHVVDRRRRVRPRRHAMRAASLHSESCPVRALVTGLVPRHAPQRRLAVEGNHRDGRIALSVPVTNG